VQGEFGEVGGHVIRVEAPHGLEHSLRVFGLEAGDEGVDFEQQTGEASVLFQVRCPVLRLDLDELAELARGDCEEVLDRV
jgi:hypothetical protein